MDHEIKNENFIPVVIVGLRTDEKADDFERAMDELERLCDAAELSVRGIVTQNLAHPDNATWIGSGKAEELTYIIKEAEAEHIVCLGNLSPAQMKNLQNIIHVPVWDRTELILEIFSKRAGTREAVLQVETAYLQYMLPRLTGMWQHLGRQSGGGGSRANKGIGEKQIELDRRQISHRITELKKELAQIDHTRDVQRKGRSKDGYPQVALVGYTNAGKSTLMNHLIELGNRAADHKSEKKVFEKDMLFATLDTSIRKIDLPGRKPFLLSDTVGFIENIPHDLIKAFRSTLAELKYADVLLIVMDISDPENKVHKTITEETLKDLDAMGIPRVYVYNKADLKYTDFAKNNRIENDFVFVSARTGEGIDDLLDKLRSIFDAEHKEIDVILPYTEGSLLNRIHTEADILFEEYKEEGVHIKANCPPALFQYVSTHIQAADSEA
ncbi:MAG: GTPase HflX [Lachnospiraceae bacterium]|nr:GTPase HflX [Lachnospiraceae bacterium]